MQYVYLAGPISGISYNKSTNWRTHTIAKLPKWISTLSPLRGKEFLECESSIKNSYENSALASAKGINTRDYNDVKRSSAVFVNLLGAAKISIGTVMEIAWARAFQKPVVCVMEKNNIHHHAMLDYACGYIVETPEDGYLILINLLGNDEQIIRYNNSLKDAKVVPMKDSPDKKEKTFWDDLKELELEDWKRRYKEQGIRQYPCTQPNIWKPQNSPIKQYFTKDDLCNTKLNTTFAGIDKTETITDTIDNKPQPSESNKKLIDKVKQIMAYHNTISILKK